MPPKPPRKGRDFFPLTVDYRENTYAAGKIPGGFFKREGRPTEKEILTSRMIDRPLRPLFPEGFSCETQIIAFVLSADKENDPDIMSITGASAATYCSPIPFYNPVAAVRIGYMNDQFVVNPPVSKLKESSLNLTVVGTEDAIVMVEAGANEISEDMMVEALDFAHGIIRKLIDLQKDLYQQIQPKKREYTKPVFDAAEVERIEKDFSKKISDALHVHGKLESYAQLDAVHEEIVNSVPEEEKERRGQADKIYHHVMEQIFRREMLEEKRRPDGRSLMKSVLFPQKYHSFREPTALHCLRAGKPRLSLPPLSGLPTTNREWTRSKANLSRDSCFIIISHHSVWERSSFCADRAGVRSAMARWRKEAFCRSCPPKKPSRTPYGLYRTSWKAMGRLPWQPCAEEFLR